MSSPADLPGRTSYAQQPSTLPSGVLPASFPRCGTSSALTRFLSHSRRVFSLRKLRHGFIALSIPAALLAGTLLPQQSQPAVAARPVLTAHAAQSPLTTRSGAAVVVEKATAGEWVFAGGSSTLGAPATKVASKVRIGTIVDDGVHLRAGPGTQHESLGTLRRGTQLEILHEADGWYRVATARGNVGWVTARFFKPGNVAVAAAAPAAPAGGPSTASVAVDDVNLRHGPNTAFNTYGKMDAGTALDVLARNGEWYKVRSPRGTIGWVANELVSISSAAAARVPLTNEVPALPKKPAAPAAGAAISAAVPAASGRNGSAARVALQYIGARYRWGGAGPGGFDCSGLTSYVYARAGKSLPHNAAAQFSTRYGTRVSLKNLAAGDLVFFANTAGRGISHVAIYVGGGMMVSANTPRSGVQYVSLYGKYWMNHYAGAIRPF